MLFLGWDWLSFLQGDFCLFICVKNHESSQICTTWFPSSSLCKFLAVDILFPNHLFVLLRTETWSTGSKDSEIACYILLSVNMRFISPEIIYELDMSRQVIFIKALVSWYIKNTVG